MTVDVDKIIQRDVPLASHTYFGIGGPAKFFAEPHTDSELAAVLEHFRGLNERVYVLGGGTNLLVSDAGVDGGVVHLAGDYAFCEFHADSTRASVGAAQSLSSVVRQSVRHGLAGLEGIVGVPGTFGGAAAMNAGGKHGNVGDVITRAEIMTLDGELRRMGREELGFEYRSSKIDGILLRAELEFSPGHPDSLPATMKDVLKQKQESQPMSAKSAGCVFKNPPDNSAGALIDRLGFKGKQVGGAQVSTKHANFIINAGGATAANVQELIQLIREKVKAEFGFDLELEIKLWGFD